MKISVIINTFNEERNIENCLKSVKWADEIIIVDMYSDDKTVEISRKYTEKVFFHERLGYADPARQFALEKASNEWVLVVDADELVPVSLKNRLTKIAEEDLADVIYIPRSNYFAGKHINGMGWGTLDDVIPRFFKKGYLNFGSNLHDFFKLNADARIYHINNPDESLIHLSYVDFEQYIERMNRYTTIEAANIFEGKKERNYLLKLFFLSIWRTFKEIILIKRYKDGFRGISLGFLGTYYALVAYMKLKLMEKYSSKDTKENVIQDYQKIVDGVILEYEK